ncbi:hypothetical protein FOZ62_021941, partial [Perkinsus olseni]
YSAEDISEVIQYADQYAIVVIPEIDVPGRTQSWIRGYPFLKGDAAYYMDPTSRMTRDMVVGVVMRVADMFGESRPDKKVLHLGGSAVGKAWDTKALEDWTRKYGKFHNKTDLINAWLRSVVARVKRHTDAEIMMWDDFLLEGAAVLTPVDTWQILNHNMEETLKLALSGRFKSLVYSTDFVLSDLGTGYGNDWTKFYDVKFKGDRGGGIKGGEAVVWGRLKCLEIDNLMVMNTAGTDRIRAVREVDFVSTVSQSQNTASQILGWNFLTRTLHLEVTAAVAERLWCADGAICPSDHTWAVNRLARWRCYATRWLLGFKGPGDIYPVGNAKDCSSAGRFFWDDPYVDQWWCPEWDKPSPGGDVCS